MTRRTDGGSRAPHEGTRHEMTWEEWAPEAGGREGYGAPPVAPTAPGPGLNPAQRAAVEHGDGALLILAGPGSGKTRVIVRRIVWLHERLGVRPEQILAVTFTNKAAGEMRERVWRMIDGEAGEISIGTFHAFCARILRYYGVAVGVPSNYVICDPDDQQTVVRDVLRMSGVPAAEWKPGEILGAISRAKNELIGAREMALRARSRSEAIAAEVRERYDETLRSAHALDFDDLLARGLDLIRLRGEAYERTAERYRHVLIDEFQDTNLAQYELAKALTSTHGNITAVGDPDQSIYSWRAADLRNIVNFERDFPNSRVVLLDQNYRSTRRILEAARAVIGLGSGRRKRKLWTENPAGDPVLVIDVAGATEEAEFIATEIARAIRDEGRDFCDFAVIYRTNSQSREIELALVREGIPYQMTSGTRFYDRREVRDLLAWLRLVQNDADALAFRRALLAPRRGVGQRSIEQLRSVAEDEGRLLAEVARAAVTRGEPRLRPAVRAALATFLDLIEELRSAAAELRASELIRRAFTGSGQEERLAEEADGATRMENIGELFRAAAQYDDLPPAESLAIFLEEVALTGGDEDAAHDAVSLTTLHGAKGLEYPVVFMPGVEEGLLPHARTMRDAAQLEEERRVCYVGMTRAQERLYLLRARTRFNPWENAVELSVRSRFLEAVPSGGIVRLSDARQHEPATLDVVAPEQRRGFEPGDRVQHALYGDGTVVTCSDTHTTVAFASRSGEEFVIGNDSLLPGDDRWLEAA